MSDEEGRGARDMAKSFGDYAKELEGGFPNKAQNETEASKKTINHCRRELEGTPHDDE